MYAILKLNKTYILQDRNIWKKWGGGGFKQKTFSCNCFSLAGLEKRSWSMELQVKKLMQPSSWGKWLFCLVLFIFVYSHSAEETHNVNSPTPCQSQPDSRGPVPLSDSVMRSN